MAHASSVIKARIYELSEVKLKLNHKYPPTCTYACRTDAKACEIFHTKEDEIISKDVCRNLMRQDLRVFEGIKPDQFTINYHYHYWQFRLKDYNIFHYLIKQNCYPKWISTSSSQHCWWCLPLLPHLHMLNLARTVVAVVKVSWLSKIISTLL